MDEIKDLDTAVDNSVDKQYKEELAEFMKLYRSEYNAATPQEKKDFHERNTKRLADTKREKKGLIRKDTPKTVISPVVTPTKPPQPPPPPRRTVIQPVKEASEEKPARKDIYKHLTYDSSDEDEPVKEAPKQETPKKDMDDISQMNVRQLKDIAKKAGIDRYYKLNKQDLISRIREYREQGSPVKSPLKTIMKSPMKTPMKTPVKTPMMTPSKIKKTLDLKPETPEKRTMTTKHIQKGGKRPELKNFMPLKKMDRGQSPERIKRVAREVMKYQKKNPDIIKGVEKLTL